MTSNANLTLVLDALNNTQGALRALKSDIKGIDDNTKRAADSMGYFQKVSQRIFTGAVVVQGIRSLRSAVGDTITAFSDQARAGAQLEAVLKSTGGAAGVTAQMANDLASELQGSTRIMDEQVLAAENMLLTFTNIKANIFPETTKAVLDMATGMNNGAVPSTEQLSKTAIQLGKALNNPTVGVTALTKVGILFSDQQKDQIQALVESGNALEAQKLILAEVNKEFGGSATNMTEFEKNLDKISDTVADTQEAIGRLVTGGINLLFRELSKHGGEIAAAFEAIKPVFAVLQRYVEERIGGIIATMKGFIKIGQGVAEVFIALAHGEWASAWDALKNVAVTAMATMANLIASIFGSIPNMAIDAVNAAIRELNKLKIPEFNAPGVGNLNPFAGGFNVPELPRLPTQIFDIGKALDTMGKAAEDTRPKTQGLATDIDDLGSAAKSASDKLKDVFSALSSAAGDLFSKPTRQLADLQLQLAQFDLTAFREKLQQEISGINIKEPTDPTLTRRGLSQAEEDRLSKQFAARQKAFEQEQSNGEKQRAAIENQIKLLELQHDVWQKQLTAADKTLITEDQLAGRFVVLRDITSAVTTQIAGMGRILDTTFRESINKIITAANELMSGKQPGKALGGPAGGLTWVGEFGRELVNLPQGSHVYDAQESRAMVNNNQRSVSVYVSRMTINGTGNRRDLDRFVGGLA